MNSLLDDRFVDLTQQLSGPWRIDPYDDPIGMQEIVDRGSFAQEFRIRRHVVSQPVRTMQATGAFVAVHRFELAQCFFR